MRLARGGALAWLLAACAFLSCAAQEDPRLAMRDFVLRIAERARAQNPSFLVVPQNALELLTLDGRPDGVLADAYVSAIDGVGQEDVSFGYTGYEERTPEEDAGRLLALLDLAEASGLPVLVVDYCRQPPNVLRALTLADAHGFAAYAAPTRNLERMASDAWQPWRKSVASITRLDQARNVLYLLNPEEFASRAELVLTLSQAEYDVLVVDAWFDAGEPLSCDDVRLLQTKLRGGRRLVLAYLSVGEAEDYRSDWDASWESRPPSWLGAENPDWPGNYEVAFWARDWQDLVMTRVDALVAAGFDGAYLDRVDAYETYESQR